MKKFAKIISLLMIAVMALGLAACSSPKTLEEYMDKNPDAKETIDEMTEGNDGLSINITDNDVVYVYDISSLNASVTEEIATSDTMKDSLEQAINGSASTFSSICSQLEEETGLSGIKVVVKYTYKDTEIISKEFTSEGN